MPMVISTDTTIDTNVVVDEVRVVNNATLTVIGSLTCKLLIIESGMVIIEGLGVIYVVEEIQTPTFNPLAVIMLYVIPTIIVFTITYLLIQLLKELHTKK